MDHGFPDGGGIERGVAGPEGDPAQDKLRLGRSLMGREGNNGRRGEEGMEEGGESHRSLTLGTQRRGGEP